MFKKQKKQSEDLLLLSVKPIRICRERVRQHVFDIGVICHHGLLTGRRVHISVRIEVDVVRCHENRGSRKF